MKKNYQAPSIKVVPLMPRQMLCVSMTISNTTTNDQWSREFDLEEEN